MERADIGTRSRLHQPQSQLVSLYIFHLTGAWRWIYVVGSVLALYLNVFVGIVQAFQKLPILKALAPKQSEPPFVFTQVAVLLLFVMLGIFTTIRFQIART